jgi:hypothetical protein
MGGSGVTGKGGPVDHQDAITLAREKHRGWRTGASRADDNRIVLLAHHRASPFGFAPRGDSVPGDRGHRHRSFEPKLAVGERGTFVPRGGSDQFALERERGGRGARRHSDLVEDVLEMATDRVVAEDQRLRDLPVGPAFRDQAEHLDLAGGQPARRPDGPRARQRRHPGHVRGGAELPEDPARRVELHLRGIVVTERPAGEPDEHPDPRGLVGRLDPLPCRPGVAQRGERRSPVALGEEGGSRGVGRHGA